VYAISVTDDLAVSTVLVVDDESIVRDVVVRYLERDGYRTLEAASGDEAQGLLEREPLSLIVLDVMLPGISGLELCRWIRLRSEVPIVLLTALGEEADRIMGLELGADDYLTKPFSPRELAVRVRNLMRRTARPAGSTMQTIAFGDVVIDPMAREAHKGGALLRRQLVAWASHDLRTPVASIQAMLDAVEDGLASMEEYMPALRQQTQTLALLIDDLFELARIDAGALTLELRKAQLPQLVSHCVAGLEAEARARQVRLESRLDDALPDVRCAPEHVQRVLLNLVTNALRHTPSDGSVLVRARRRAGELEVSAEDTGVGLSSEAQQRMFERFWRGDASRTRASGGAGLGLAIARGFVEAQGGRIWAENRPEGGARFAFTLPLAEPRSATA
jgi:signal transduction histidine kinase